MFKHFTPSGVALAPKASTHVLTAKVMKGIMPQHVAKCYAKLLLPISLEVSLHLTNAGVQALCVAHCFLHISLRICPPTGTLFIYETFGETL